MLSDQDLDWLAPPDDAIDLSLHCSTQLDLAHIPQSLREQDEDWRSLPDEHLGELVCSMWWDRTLLLSITELIPRIY